MADLTDGFEQFYAEQFHLEPETLRGLIDGWNVLESRGTQDHRVLLLSNALGEKRVLKQFSHGQNARMRAELAALNGAADPGIPRLFDYAEDERYVYLVREYVEGQNLEEWVAARGTLSVREAAHIGVQLCAVLSQLHRRGIIHRDVKPQNVIMTPGGQVCLIDFDISRKYNESETHDTEYLGTRSIAPPEQFGYGQTDARTDIYSLGVVLLYLATGTYDLRNIRHLPKPLAHVVRHCTYFAPERRYQTAAQLQRRLRGLENRPRRLMIALAATVLALACAAVALFCFRSPPHVYPTLPTVAADAVIAFEEPLIEQCVRAQLQKPADEPLRYADVSKVTEIHLYGDYTDGTENDIDYRENLVYVNGQVINQGSVTTLDDLLYMPGLRVLRLFRQPLSNVDALAPLTRLEELYLDESPNISDVAVLSKLEKLRTLDLSDTAVQDLSPLAGCPKLRQINLERIPCTDFSVLSRYPYLEYLNVNGASPDAVIAAVRGKMVDYLWLDFSGLTGIEPFTKAEGVKQLHAKNNSIRSLAGIEALTTLEYVDVAFNPVEDLTPLLSLPRLKALRIDHGLEKEWAQIEARAKFSVEWQN